ncbi:MAG TPA: hypothetical protein VFQ91_02975, partial [Bryobacteraceae bacterium]|nr:hypothetical protein [Bryobacteraceae bacterium]
MNKFLLAAFLFTSLVSSQTPPVVKPFPEFGEANRWNRYEAKFTEVFRLDFEDAAAAIQILAPSVQLTSDPAEVIGGKFSVKLTGPQPVFVIPPSLLNLQPGRVYVVEYDYKVLYSASPLGFVRTLLISTARALEGKTVIDIGGPLALSSSPKSGSDSRGYRIPDAHGMTFGFSGSASTFILDNIRILRQDQVLLPAQMSASNHPFPRIMNY